MRLEKYGHYSMVTREFIVSEIRRTAVENGGAPLGRRRFAVETGIRESDWFGKFWANWGAALVEAGYEPNQKQARYTDEYVLGHLGRFIIELGHFPVVAELKMKARADEDFPSHNTFRRFGGKAGLAGALADYVAGKPEMSDIEEMCRALATKPGKTEEPGGQPASAGKVGTFGTVYLMKSGKYYKIGRTNVLGRRERELAIQLPEPVRTIHSIQTDDPSGIEAYWHRRFAEKRANGEWFDLTSEDVQAFKRRKFM